MNIPFSIDSHSVLEFPINNRSLKKKQVFGKPNFSLITLNITDEGLWMYWFPTDSRATVP